MDFEQRITMPPNVLEWFRQFKDKTVEVKISKEGFVSLWTIQQSRSLPVYTIGNDATDKHIQGVIDGVIKNVLSANKDVLDECMMSGDPVRFYESEDGTIKAEKCKIDDALKAYQTASNWVYEHLEAKERRTKPRGDVARGLVDAALVGADVREIVD